MRTLIHVDIRNPISDDDDSKIIKTWLMESGFRAEEIKLDPEQIDFIKKDLRIEEIDPELEKITEISDRQAAEIFFSIPINEQERLQAIKTAKFTIHYYDNIHGTTVWGLVCIDSPTMSVRWRHRVSRSLERATEEFISNVWLQAGPDKIFKEFVQGQVIPIREPQSTTDAYIGEILPPGPLLKDLAKRRKFIEIKIAKWSLIATIILFFAGGFLFYYSTSESFVRWISGSFDRLATTSAASAAVSYLNYLFHLHELKSKPIIDWK